MTASAAAERSRVVVAQQSRRAVSALRPGGTACRRVHPGLRPGAKRRDAASAFLFAVLVAALALPAGGETLVARSGSWSYRKGTAEASDPRTDWRNLDFGDAAWARGRLPLGYGAAGLNTTLTDMQGSYTTVFLRRTFDVTALDAETRLRASVDYDDGFIIWINGERVFAENEPDGTPLYDSLASDYHTAGVFETNDLPNPDDYLEPGQNVIAVQLFNVTPDSGDAKIDVELSSYKRVADTKFSHDRGFYDTPFTCTVSTTTAGATIRYTLNGDDPRTGSGVMTVAAPSGTILIDPDSSTGRLINGQKAGCVVLRAYAVKAGYEPCNVDTQTYIFLGKVVQQKNLMSGENWAAATPDAVMQSYMNTEMDPAVLNDSRYSAKMVSSLQALPTLSIAADYAGLWSDSHGFFHYPNSENHGDEWERACSAELIYPDGKDGFQLDCGIRLQGNSSHVDSMFTKKGLRLAFKKVFGPGKLRFPFFQDAVANADTDPEEYDTLTLRGGANNTWGGWEAYGYISAGGDKERISYTRDQWMRDTQILMSGVGYHGTFVHLYLNGIYWGLYNPCEDTREGTMAVMFGGEKEDWFTARRDDPEWWSGDSTRWVHLHSVLSTRDMNVEANYAEAKAYLDVEEFADYILLNWYAGDGDWPGKNYGSSVLNAPPGRTRYFCWDSESTWILADKRSYNGAWIHPAFYDSSWSKYSAYQPRLWRALDNSKDFRCTVADRVYASCYNDGPLAEPAAKARYQALCDRVEEGVIAESARWGDHWEVKYGSTWTTRMGSMPFHRDGYWYTARDKVLNDMDGNVAQFVAILRSNPYGIALYPSIDPPAFQQHGGAVSTGFKLTMSSPHSASYGSIYYTVDGSDPRLPGGGKATAATRYTGALTLSRTTHVRARLYKSNNTWSALHAATYNFTAHYDRLRITEILYNPLGGSDYEFVEIKNTGSSVRGLSGMQLKGVGYSFAPGAELAGGETAVLVRNEGVFTNRYPTVKGAVRIFGVYDGRLDNGGERLSLLDAEGRTVTAVRYNDKDPWPDAADGDGYSLVVVDENGDPADPANWRASNLIGGSPGYDDGLPYRVVINEALTHTDLPQVDTIELLNAGSAAVDIGGWYLSDSRADYRKFEVPAGTVLGAGGYALFDEGDFNDPTNDPSSFALSSHGDELYLTKWDGNGNLQYVAEARFGGAANGVAFGRYVKSDGESDFVAQSVSNTLGAANAGPLVGPVVINELMYHPVPGASEFIELFNVSQTSVKLYDPGTPANTWRMDGAVEYVFPAGVELGAGAYALVVPTNAAAFRAAYGIPADVQIFGPYAGVLNNGGESVKLWRPDTPDELGVPLILVDRVKYDDNSPWPECADGDGPSLERQDPAAYGNDAVNWAASLAAGGTPGARNSGGLVSKSAGWKYHDKGLDFGTAWRGAAYDDAGWEDGNGPLGYGYPDVDTIVSYGDDPANKYPTTFFRGAFTLGADPGNVTNLTLRVKYDDGFVAYLNGVEVARGAISGTVAYSTLAANHTASDYEPFELLAHAGALVPGVNVLAVELHQSSAGSSDLYLDAELAYAASALAAVATPAVAPADGTVFTNTVQVTCSTATAGATVFYTTTGSDPTDTSYAGYGVGTVQFTLSASATVKARAYKAGMAPSAIGQAYLERYLPTAATPTITPDGGDFYGSVQVTLATSTAGATLFYTTNGLTPAETVYSGYGTGSVPFSLSSSRTVKARAYRAGYNASEVAVAAFTDRTPSVAFDAAASNGSEGLSPATLGVSLSGTSPQTVRVGYAVTGGSASGGGTDYTLAGGTLTFAPGETGKSITLAITDDELEEQDETVVVTLSGPANAVLGTPASHTYTLNDNDSLFTAYNDLGWAAGQLAQNITRYTRGQSGLLKDYASGEDTAVTLSVAGGDGPVLTQGADPQSGTDAHAVFDGIVDGVGLISYGPTNLTLRFTGLDPTLRYEFVLFGNRHNADYLDRYSTIAISDVDAFRNESSAGTDFSGPASDSVVITNGYNTVNGFVARFSQVDPGTDGDMTVTVSDNASRFYANALRLRALSSLPVVAFAASASSGEEADAVVNLEVSLSAASAAAVTVDYSVTGGTAGGGTDYALAAGTLTFSSGQTSRSIGVAIVEDPDEEGDETVVLSLSSPVNAVLGANATHTYTIQDDDGPVLMFTAYNDLCWDAAHPLLAGITGYSAFESTNGWTTGGALIDCDSGTNLAATLSVGGSGTYFTSYPDQGGNAGAGTDAGAVFGGKVDCVGNIAYGTYTFLFAGLDPAWEYELVFYGGRDKTTYLDKLATFTIADTAGFENESTPGTAIYGAGGAWTNDVTRYNTGNNVADGYVARFTRVKTGADGDVLVTVDTTSAAGGENGYLDALMIRAVRTGDSGPSPEEKIARGAVWKYRDGSTEASDPPAAWRAPGFDDASWATGPAPFGYNGTGLGTDLDGMRYHYSSVFLRSVFVLEAPSRVAQVRLSARYDDGFIVWLNGEEAARVNVAGAPGAFVLCDGLAEATVEPTDWSATFAAETLPVLVAGTNQVAVQVFNAAVDSSDLRFDLDLSVLEAATAGDTDADGMPNDWEAEYLGGPDVVNGGTEEDFDGDGVSNMEEWIAGTDPAAAGEYFAVTLSAAGGQILVSFPARAADGTGYAGYQRYHTLERRSDVRVGGYWELVPGYTGITGAGQTVVYTNSGPGGAEYYRARVWLAE
ncbi:MAG: lamin tail domain-containing protein [Kiritimatiellae bacterium]|nr:lamin tail domain-containing protein [Kiritimatiellia bacterium]